MKAKLERSRKDRIISGVCGGMAEYFGIDAVIIRILFVVLILINFFQGILLYIVLAIIMPEAEKAGISAGQTGVEEAGGTLEPAGEAVEGKEIVAQPEVDRPERARWLGVILILFGLYFVLNEYGIFRWMRNDIVLPLILIILGVWLLISRTRGRQ